MSPTRRELVRATRTRIVDAAGRLTRDRGASGFSMDVLAKEAGVARATVYEHFRSKRAVLDELALSTSQSLALESPDPDIADPLTALRDMLGAVCRHWHEHEAAVREVRTLVAVTSTEAPTDGVAESYLVRLVDGLVAGGHLRPRWSAADAVDALALLTSYATYEQLRVAHERTPEQIEAVLAKLAVSIVSPSG